MNLLQKIILAAALAAVIAGCATAPEDGTAEYPVADKKCALTFDDGPDAAKTARVLDVLEEYDVPATFFCIGQKVTGGTKNIMLRAQNAGCEFANHSWAYNSMGAMTEEEIIQSVTDTSDAIEETVGVRPRFFRAPNLNYSATLYRTIRELGLGLIQGIDSKDWQPSTTAEQRANNILDSRMLKDGAIFLFHDVQGAVHPTPEALRILIPELKMQGYEFVTVSELFESNGVDPLSKTNGPWTNVK